MSKVFKTLIVVFSVVVLAIAGYLIYQKINKPYTTDRCFKESMVPTGDCCRNCSCIDAVFDQSVYDICLNKHIIEK